MDDNIQQKRGRGRPRKDSRPEDTPPVETPPAVPDAPVKRGRGRPPLTEEEKQRRDELRAQGIQPIKSNFGQENIEPGDNSRFLSHAMAVMNMPPIDVSDVNQVERRIQEYMILCNDYDMKPTVKGFCNALRISRTTLFEWKRGTYRANTHQEMICRAYDLLEELWENYMQNGKINPVSGIFLGKNNFGYADKQEYVLTPNRQQETLDVATIEAKYAELPDYED